MNHQQKDMLIKRIEKIKKSMAEIDEAIQNRNLDGPTLNDIQQDRRDYATELKMLEAKLSEMEGSHE